MAARSTGFAMLSSASVQQAQDLALIAHAATRSHASPLSTSSTVSAPRTRSTKSIS
ncbi:hypothetical protein O0544_14180 [Edwardsiella anguillarum]|nr:hypothetical protein [Edwardsiella anguillarum]